MERYLGEEDLSVHELERALAHGIATATVFPVLCGSATKLVGVDRLARFIVDDGPAPQIADDGPPAVFVFKTIVDPYVGRINVFKVLSGAITTDAVLVNGRTVTDERLHQLVVLRGKDQQPVSEVPAGDLGAVTKLASTTTGDVLGTRGASLDVTPAGDPAADAAGRHRRVGQGRRGQAGHRPPPPPGRGPGHPRRAESRDPPDRAVGDG